MQPELSPRGIRFGAHVYSVNMMATRDRIVAAARQILLEEGAAAVSTRRVAGVVGTTPMALYRHFANRDALLKTVADETFAEIARRWTEKPRQDDVNLRARELIDDHLDFALGQPHLYDFLFTEVRHEARSFSDDFRAGRSPTLNLVAENVSDGMRQGLLREDDVWETTLTIAALLHGLVALHRGGRIGLSDNEFRALCHGAVERILNGLRR